MNRIKIAILLVLSISCLVPAEVRAEAPTPKGGCWSREIASRPIDDPAIVTIQGRVIAIEYSNQNQPIAAKEAVTWVRLKTIDNGEKSIYLGSERLLKQQQLPIKVGDSLKVQGVQAPKSKQLSTIIASTVKKGDRVWKINHVVAKPSGAKWCRYSG
jgi:hypothetical protein